MCLIAVAPGFFRPFPLVIAANRDEFYDRPSAPAAPWPEDPRVIGGRDLRGGGSWLAVRAGGRFGAVTNIRGSRTGGPSRGLLVSNFVLGDADAFQYALNVDRGAYAGFHLIVGDTDRIVHVTNADDAMPSVVPPGQVFAVSNGLPGEDWPKVQSARYAMNELYARFSEPTTRLLDFLTTRRGVPIEQEVFVAVPERGYGTRSSTVIVVDENGAVTFIERAAPSGAEVRWRLPSRS